MLALYLCKVNGNTHFRHKIEECVRSTRLAILTGTMNIRLRTSAELRRVYNEDFLCSTYSL